MDSVGASKRILTLQMKILDYRWRIRIYLTAIYCGFPQARAVLQSDPAQGAGRDPTAMNLLVWCSVEACQ